MFIWDNWLIVALLGSIVYAIINLIDCYFVSDVYHNEYDGTVISALFQVVAVLLVLVVSLGPALDMPDNKTIILAIFGGLFYAVSTFFYFKAMFVESDASIIETMFSLSMFLVPFLAYFLIGEILTLRQYLGIAIAFIGVNIPIIDRKINKEMFFRVFKIMFGSILFLALCLTTEEYVYQKTNFSNGYLLFSIGSILGGVIFFIFGKVKNKINFRGLLKLNKKYYIIFFISEILAVSGVTFTQRALDRSPAASFVAMIDAFQPMFIIIISSIVFIFSKIIFSKYTEKIRAIYALQSRAFVFKFIAILIIILGVYLIN